MSIMLADWSEENVDSQDVPREFLILHESGARPALHLMVAAFSTSTYWYYLPSVDHECQTTRMHIAKAIVISL